MKWGEFELKLGQTFKINPWPYLIKRKLTFKFHHLTSSNSTFIDKEFEEKKKNIYQILKITIIFLKN